MAVKECAIPDCGNKVKARGLCNKHYVRAWKSGAIQITFTPTLHCTINGCGKPHKARGYCAMHYNRWQRTGDPEHTTERDTGCGTPAGYYRHRAAGEDACRPCKDAQNEYNRVRRANLPKRPKPVARDVPAGTPRCGDCDRPMMGRHTTKKNLAPGWSRKHSEALCTRCYDRARRERLAANAAEVEAPVTVDPALEAMMRKRRQRLARLARQQRLTQVRRPAA